MSASSDWYRDPDAVVNEVRRATQSRGQPTIAGYDDLLELQRGGQGVVFAATQRSTRRRVAIKLLLEGAFATEASRRRFAREIELVAGLRHPNIVRIFDSGETEDGRPFYVMEYVEGAPLEQALAGGKSGSSGEGGPARAARTARAKVQHALRLLLPVCDAVQYAHQRGVIHRDLKSGNIRVDDDGVPRVLDFGLAKLVGASPASAAAGPTALTVSGQFAGSLPWASPEQVRGDLDAIDTRTDVYALGVLVYQLLAGRFPYDVSSGLREAMDSILSAEPARLSALLPGVDGDVETIALKCLAKDPQRRYQSVGELGDDLRRYLAGEPIQARRDSAWYTLNRLLRRYRTAAIAGAAVLAVALIGLVISLVFYGRALQQSARADAERSRAEEKARQAEAVSAFLTSMLGAPDPFREGRDVRIAQVLDDAAARIPGVLEDQPDVEATVRATLGRCFLSLGMLDEADTQLTAGLALAAQRFGAESAETLAIQGDLARLRNWQGRLEEADVLGRRTLEARRRMLGAEHAATLETAGNLADVLRARGHFEESIALDRETLAAQERVLGPRDEATLSTQHRLATALQMSGRLNEAQALLEKSLADCRAALGVDHPYCITALGELARLYHTRGQYERAEPLMSEALERSRRVLGEDHPATLTARENWAALMGSAGRGEDAVPILRELLEAQQRALGDEHPKVLLALSNLGVALSDLGRPAEAEPLYRRAVELAPRVLGPEHPDTLLYQSNLAVALGQLRQFEEAERLLRSAFEGATRALGSTHASTANYENLLGRLLMVRSRFEEAEPHLLASLAAFSAALGERHPYTIEALSDAVRLYENWGKQEQAEVYRARAAAISTQPAGE